MSLDFSRARITVVGDMLQDEWVYGRVERISPEAPIPVFIKERVTVSPGGVGNVLANLRALGCDPLGLWDVTTANRKTRYIAGRYQMFRADQEEIKPTDREEEIFATATQSPCDAMVLSDYGKGIFIGTLAQRIIRWCNEHAIPSIIDPKGKDWVRYKGAFVVTPNLVEMDGRLPSMTLAMLDLHAILVTKGPKGMDLHTEAREPLTIESAAREVFDVVGAGDSVVATLAACMAIGMDLPTSARIANAAAGVVVGKAGTATCSLAELEAAL